MDLDEVTRRLGLEPWNRYKIGHIGRDTGRTTKIICEALVALSQGKEIGLHGGNDQMTMNMFTKTATYARELNLDVKMIRPVYNVDSIRGSDIILFEDHNY